MSENPRTIARYLKEAGLHELTTEVVCFRDVNTFGDEERALFKTVLDQVEGTLATKETIFHPQGGGQPSDRGIITDKNNAQLHFEVKLVRKLPSGLILHAGNRFPAGSETVFHGSQSVVLSVDSVTRNYHSRLHTAGHLIGLAVRRLSATIGPVEELKANHAPGSAFVEFKGLIGGEHKTAIQHAVDNMVNSGLQVEVCWWDAKQVREKCTAVPESVAFHPGEDLMRVVQVQGLGAYPCGGTHLPTTTDVGKITVRRISRQKGISKISYEVQFEKSD
ncbi:putative alanyl-tRNA synthetase [Xylariaceae sp. FL0016]|nr:putative alanyl-tRNA synthetase [Xylariaceae sp. FL0016]